MDLFIVHICFLLFGVLSSFVCLFCFVLFLFGCFYYAYLWIVGSYLF